MAPVHIALWIVLGAALLISVVTDVSSARILDAVTWPALAVLLAMRFGFDGAGDLEAGVVTGLVASGGLMALFALWAGRGRMGWGDVKLMGVVGAAFGVPDALKALVWIAVAGAVQALATLLWQGARRDSVRSAPRHVPYAVAIAAGSACAMWASRI